MGRRRYSQLQGISEINITPLMDLTFLLLIVFMITAPMLEYSVNVTPPKMNADQIEHENNVLISLDAGGAVVFRKQKMDLAGLARHLADVHAARPDALVLIRAHEERPYREVVGIMKTVRRARFDNVSLVTQAEE